MKLTQVIKEARSCRECATYLPEGPRPLFQVSSASRLVIIGQAPGAVAHESGVPWDDASGRRLRDWLGVTDEVFYEAKQVALMPMGFCYPGKGGSGDLAPRQECAPLWHPGMLSGMKKLRLTLLIGRYAMERYLSGRYRAITEAVADYEALLPDRLVLPHPSPRNNIWLKKNSWFEKKLVPRLRTTIAKALA
ncbi:MAG: uracil-DNA glycosylase family protein [Phycisphaeraceae bacterium]